MLSLPRLVILAQQGQHERLIDAVLRNGRPLPVPLRARLADEHNAPIAALALGVQRYLELAARPTIPLRELIVHLLDTLGDTPAAHASLPARVLALAALADAEQALGATPSPDDHPLLARIAHARAGVWHALACAQNLDPDADPPFGAIADTHTTALILRQLPKLPDASVHLHLPLLVDAAFTLDLTRDPLIADAIGALDAATSPAEIASSSAIAAEPIRTDTMAA
ncbi:MAG: hypothetical protein ACTS3F_07810 [Phycisphaerales bacterium]